MPPASLAGFHPGHDAALITAFASLLPDGGLLGDIAFLPEGEHTITPFVDGKPTWPVSTSFFTCESDTPNCRAISPMIR